MPHPCCHLSFVINTTTPKTALQQCRVLDKIWYLSSKGMEWTFQQSFWNIYHAKHMKGGLVWQVRPSGRKERNWIWKDTCPKYAMCSWPPAMGKKSYFHLFIPQPGENSSQAADFICLIFVDTCKSIEGWAIKQAFTSFAKNTNAVFKNFKMQSCVWGWSVCW